MTRDGARFDHKAAITQLFEQAAPVSPGTSIHRHAAPRVAGNGLKGVGADELALVLVLWPMEERSMIAIVAAPKTTYPPPWISPDFPLAHSRRMIGGEFDRQVELLGLIPEAILANHRVIGKQVQRLSLGVVALFDVLANARYPTRLGPAVGLVPKARELNAWYRLAAVVHQTPPTLALKTGIYQRPLQGRRLAQGYDVVQILFFQAAKHNGGAWAMSVEQATRKYAERASGNVYVITGPFYEPSIEASPGIGPGKVRVPKYLFKLVYDEDRNRAWAHWHLNDDATHGSRPISYADLVKRTGISFLPGVRPND